MSIKMTLTVSDITSITEEVKQKWGSHSLYREGIQALADSSKISEIFTKAENTPGSELVETLQEALDEDENTDVLIEDLIEHLGNVKNYKGFKHIITDADLSDYAPIYLLEQWGEI